MRFGTLRKEERALEEREDAGSVFRGQSLVLELPLTLGHTSSQICAPTASRSMSVGYTCWILGLPNPTDTLHLRRHPSWLMPL
jgi:hypothetical protein